MKKRGKRQANFELLRIVAMLMILSLHYLVKGYLALPATQESGVGNDLAHLIEAFCIVAVNCYVLLSGYFLCADSGSGWKPGRVVSLLCQVLFYSLLIPCVLLAFGVAPAGELTLYDWIGFVFPIGTEHYWFATAYFGMYLFAPFLAGAVERMEKRQLQTALFLLLLLFSAEKTILPVSLATDRYGYDFGWFLCLFLTAGYLRKYGIAWLEKRGHALLLYGASCLAIWGLYLLSHFLGGFIDAFSYYEEMPYTYNHVLCLTGAVSLFYVFKNMQIKEGRFGEVVCRIAPYTFGIYLLHEHLYVRYAWMKWLGVEQTAGSILFLPHMILCVTVVYGVGTVIDMARAWIFGQAVRIFQGFGGKKAA